MRTKRDRRQTPKGTSLALGSQSSIDKMFDDWLSDAVPPEGMEFKAGWDNLENQM